MVRGFRMRVLVTGAAGYIGSVVAEELVAEGNLVVALDNLSKGHSEAVAPEAVFVQADVGDPGKIDEVLQRHRVEAVVHLAAESLVGESMTDPGKYFRSNVVSGIRLVDAMLRHGVHKFILSSTAAVYGEPGKMPIEENDPALPVNPYGESKLMFEKVLHWYGNAYGLRFISLRYFNAAGASARFGEDHDPETHLIPNVLKVALGQREYIPIFGTDYDTRDGSCLRDYIHVADIAQAHILALKHLEECQTNRIYNLGNGEGYSVIEVLETARKVTGNSIPAVTHPRRPGDPPVLIASSKLAKSELGWQPKYPDLGDIVESAWRWQKGHPHGYRNG